MLRQWSNQLTESRRVLQRYSGRFAVLAAFVLPISTALLNFSLIVSVLLNILSGKGQDYYHLIRKNRVAQGFLVFFLLFIFGLSYTSAAFPDAISTVQKYSKFVLGFFLFSVFQETKTARHALIAFLIATTLTLLISYWQYFTHHTLLSRFAGDSGVFKDHIFTGFLFAFASYCYVVIAILSPKWRVIAGIFAFLASYNVLFINIGRTGYLVWFALMIVIAWQQYRWSGLLVSFLLTLFLIGGSLFFSSPFQERYAVTHHEIQGYEQGQVNTSIGLRLHFYEMSAQLIRQHPWFGVGTGGYQQAYTARHSTSFGVKNNPHSEYLNITVQFGLFGLSVLLLLFALHWQQSLLLTPQRQFLAQGVLVAMVVGSLFNSWLMDNVEGLFYVFFTAMAFSTAALCPKYIPQSCPKKQKVAGDRSQIGNGVA
jgi:O-antigen ligase